MKRGQQPIGRISRWVITIAIALLMVVAGIATPLFGNAREALADQVNVSSWSELKNAVEAGEHTITLGNSFAYDGTSVVIPSDATITITGGETIFSTKADSYDSMFKVESGGKLIIDEEVTLSAKTGNNGQTCPEGSVYSADSFTGEAVGTTYDPKGFFIQVEAGGTATLNGTISDFVTSRNKATTPRYVAPVVAYGKDATFNI